MGKMFTEQGKIVLWDSYEFAPIGRPHLYPPLEHILIWFFRSLTHASYMVIGRGIVVFQTFMALGLTWFISRKFFNAFVAFLALVFFTAGAEHWWWQTAVTPLTLVALLFLPTLFLYYKRHILISILALTACLYLHYGLSLYLILVIFSATISQASYRKVYLKNFFIILGASLILFSPWLLHVYHFKYYLFHHAKPLPTQPLFSLNVPYEKILPKLNMVFWIFLIPGMVYCFRRIKEDFKYCLFFVGFLCSFLYLFFFDGIRFHAHLPIVNSTIAALGAGVVLEARKYLKSRMLVHATKVFLGSLIVSVVFVESHFLTEKRVSFSPTPLLNEIRAFVYWRPLERQDIRPFFNNRETQLLLDFVRQHIDKEEIIHINRGDLADYITLQTDRKTDSGMYWEIVTPEMMKKVYALRTKGYFISSIKNFDNLLPEDYIEKKKFPVILRKIGQTYIGYL